MNSESDPMAFLLVLQMLFSLVGGLGLFLVGMKHMSEGLQTVAGEGLRKVISIVTDNRLLGILVGIFVTCVVQSSSITTVMVVGLVNSGFMTLTQSIGVILGANVGTTITGWILTLNIGKYGLPLLGVASFFFLFSKRDGIRYAGMAVMGIGMVFFGLELMSNGFKPLREMEQYRMWFYTFSADTYGGVLKCMLVGCLLTVLVQSSSATLGITMGLAMSGVIRFETAAALVLGENIGTTITALLASLGVGTNARRAAYAHIVFNLVGALSASILFLPVCLPLIRSIIGHDPNTMVMRGGEAVYPYILAAIALTHTGFNVANVVFFIPLLKPLVWLVTRMAPDKVGSIETAHLAYLDVRMLGTPELGIVQSGKEVNFMARSIDEMLEWLLKHIQASGKKPNEWMLAIVKREQDLDRIQEEVVAFLGQLVSGQISRNVMETARRQLRLADEYESLSDYIVSVTKGIAKLRSNSVTLLPEEMEDLLALHGKVVEYVGLVRRALEADDINCMVNTQGIGKAVVRFMKDCRRRHVTLLSSHDIPPLQSTVYMDVLNYYRRMRDHALNIAEIVSREK